MTSGTRNPLSEPLCDDPAERAKTSLHRAFLGKEDAASQLIAGVIGAVCGVVLLLVA